MEQTVDLHQQAVEIARRILSGSESERYDLGVAGPNDNSRVFNDLVEIAQQILRQEEWRRSRRKAA
jgi:hypothetical protein